MDGQARINTYLASLRIIYTGDIPGLRKKIAELHAEAEGGVVITSSGYEGEQSAGQLVLEPLEKLNAAIALLTELDDTAPTAPETVVYADFRLSEGLQT